MANRVIKRFRTVAAGGLAWALAIAFLFPATYLVLVSLGRDWPYPEILPTTISLSLWRATLSGSTELMAGLLTSCVVSLSVGALSTAAGYLAARYVAYSRSQRGLVSLTFVPYAMSPVVLGACMLYLYLKTGLAGHALGVVVAQTLFGFGFAVVFFNALWGKRLKALEDLVSTLGGSRAQAFRFVLLPASKGMLWVCFVQTFLISWFQYGLTLLIGSGRVRTLPVLVYAFINEADMPLAALASCLLVLPPVILAWVNRAFLLREGFRL